MSDKIFIAPINPSLDMRRHGLDRCFWFDYGHMLAFSIQRTAAPYMCDYLHRKRVIRWIKEYYKINITSIFNIMGV